MRLGAIKPHSPCCLCLPLCCKYRCAWPTLGFLHGLWDPNSVPHACVPDACNCWAMSPSHCLCYWKQTTLQRTPEFSFNQRGRLGQLTSVFLSSSLFSPQLMLWSMATSQNGLPSNLSPDLSFPLEILSLSNTLFVYSDTSSEGMCNWKHFNTLSDVRRDAGLPFVDVFLLILSHGDQFSSGQSISGWLNFLQQHFSFSLCPLVIYLIPWDMQTVWR